MTAQAELDGLGPADGPVITWTVPADFARAEPQGALPFDFTPGSASPGTGTPSWLGLVCLLLVVVLLLIRTSSKGPPPATPCGGTHY